MTSENTHPSRDRNTMGSTLKKRARTILVSIFSAALLFGGAAPASALEFTWNYTTPNCSKVKTHTRYSPIAGPLAYATHTYNYDRKWDSTKKRWSWSYRTKLYSYTTGSKKAVMNGGTKYCYIYGY